MTRVVAIADRLAQPALWLVAALHLLFLASVVAIFLAAPASAQPACSGKDLFAELKQRDPAKLATIEAKAAKTPNGESTLWRIEKNGTKPSWLFGTIHMTDPRVTALNPEARKAFDESDRLVIETTDVLNEARLMGQLAQRPDLMMFTDNTTIAPARQGPPILRTRSTLASATARPSRSVPLRWLRPRNMRLTRSRSPRREARHRTPIRLLPALFLLVSC